MSLATHRNYGYLLHEASVISVIIYDRNYETWCDDLGVGMGCDVTPRNTPQSEIFEGASINHGGPSWAYLFLLRATNSTT